MKFITKYRQFHAHEPRKIGEFHPDLVIPEGAACMGEAKQVLYRSDKLNPSTLEDEGWIDYFHDHDGGVQLYRCDRAAMTDPDADVRRVPAWLRGARELTWLGHCLGFTYLEQATGRKRSARSTAPLPELFCVPSGKALLVIQGKRRLLALAWGGRLTVEARGIVH